MQEKETLNDSKMIVKCCSLNIEVKKKVRYKGLYKMLMLHFKLQSEYFCSKSYEGRPQSKALQNSSLINALQSRLFRKLSIHTIQ